MSTIYDVNFENWTKHRKIGWMADQMISILDDDENRKSGNNADELDAQMKHEKSHDFSEAIELIAKNGDRWDKGEKVALIVALLLA